MERRSTCHSFDRVGIVQPERDGHGLLMQWMPGSSLDSPLHKYGNGPFCSFTIAQDARWRRSGVYVLTVGGATRYIGECKSLAMIWASVGHITLSSVRRGGRQTHCRLNTLILNEAEQNSEAVLWFEPIEDDAARSVRKAQLIADRNPPWDLPTSRRSPTLSDVGAPPRRRTVRASASAQRPSLRQDPLASERQFGGLRFSSVAPILPERDARGRVVEHFPHSRFRNRSNLPLSRYGAGPFCRFRVAQGWSKSGVYVLTQGDEVRYVGECKDLDRRWGPMGYGHISPRACYKGGQDTNCRINNLIHTESKAGGRFHLWLHGVEGNKQARLCVESLLVASLAPSWNR